MNFPKKILRDAKLYTSLATDAIGGAFKTITHKRVLPWMLAGAMTFGVPSVANAIEKQRKPIPTIDIHTSEDKLSGYEIQPGNRMYILLKKADSTVTDKQIMDQLQGLHRLQYVTQPDNKKDLEMWGIDDRYFTAPDSTGKSELVVLTDEQLKAGEKGDGFIFDRIQPKQVLHFTPEWMDHYLTENQRNYITNSEHTTILDDGTAEFKLDDLVLALNQVIERSNEQDKDIYELSQQVDENTEKLDKHKDDTIELQFLVKNMSNYFGQTSYFVGVRGGNGEDINSITFRLGTENIGVEFEYGSGEGEFTQYELPTFDNDGYKLTNDIREIDMDPATRYGIGGYFGVDADPFNFSIAIAKTWMTREGKSTSIKENYNPVTHNLDMQITEPSKDIRENVDGWKFSFFPALQVAKNIDLGLGVDAYVSEDHKPKYQLSFGGQLRLGGAR